MAELVLRAPHRHGCRRAGARCSPPSATTASTRSSTPPCPSRSTSPRSVNSSIPPAATEREALAELRALADRNTVRTSMIGLGYYGTITPAVIKRNVLENPSWYTAYTPYQPEISQGRLEALINFQTMVTDLTGLDTANASMLDEGTAVVEGMLLARRASKPTSNVFVVDADAFPQTKALLASRAEAVGIELVEVDFAAAWRPRSRGRASASSSSTPAPPAASGTRRPSSRRSRTQGGLAVVAADLLALTLITSPGELGADVAVGTSQRFGVPMGFGGPHAGYMAVRTGLERQLPGRLVGVEPGCRRPPRLPAHPADARAAHPPREGDLQHLHRAGAAGRHGGDVRRLPRPARAQADRHRDRARAPTSSPASSPATASRSSATTFFDTIRVHIARQASTIIGRAREPGINLHLVDDATVGISVDETTTAADLVAVVVRVRFLAGRELDIVELATRDHPPARRAPCARATYLTHPVFNTHHSETAMMRYLKHLADKDYALDRGMIPLGSCTMKLNAATEMEAVTWPEFAGLHPFAPEADVEGYLELIEQLESWLAEVTGYDSVSLQPNAGSQGELAGLLAIRGYHRANGDVGAHRLPHPVERPRHQRGLRRARRHEGRRRRLRRPRQRRPRRPARQDRAARRRPRRADDHLPVDARRLRARGRAITQAVHDAGGQVYVDGANLNALLGFARFGDFGGDVSHLNLHKTFCIPHGGGGPGVGPVAAKAHLAPFLPGHPLAQRDDHGRVTARPADRSRPRRTAARASCRSPGRTCA